MINNIHTIDKVIFVIQNGFCLLPGGEGVTQVTDEGKYKTI